MTIPKKLLVPIFLGIALPPSWAQEAQPQQAVPLQGVQVVGVRDPAMMPYKTAHELLTRIASASDGRVRVLVRAVSAESRQPFSDLHISLQGENFFENVAVSPNGLITVPVSQAAYEGNADFLTNKKKGALNVDIHLVPVLASENLTYGDITASIGAARLAMRELVPWYLRLLAPSIDAVGICYPDKGQSVSISKAPGLPRPALTEAKSPTTGGKMFCASFSLTEQGLAKDSTLSLPLGWEAIFQ